MIHRFSCVLIIAPCFLLLCVVACCVFVVVRLVILDSCQLFVSWCVLVWFGSSLLFVVVWLLLFVRCWLLVVGRLLLLVVRC